jgi:hypothetical protein
LIPYLAYRRDASWWSNFAAEVAAAALFRAAALLFILASVLGRGGVGGSGEEEGRSAG